MRDHFEQLADRVCVAGPGLERVGLSYAGESSDFIRFNQARVRQATHVQQRHATVTVVAGARRASATRALSGDVAADAAALAAERDLLAQQLPWVPEDPFLLLPDEVHSTTREATGALPSPQQLIDAVTAEGAGTDLVGFYAGGPVTRAFADSRGQRNWHRVDSFDLDWSLVLKADLAVKASYAGSHWDRDAFSGRMDSARKQLEILARPRMTLAPGAYRVYLSPIAVAELLATLSWGGFSERGVRTGVSSLTQLYRHEREFHPSVRLTEATAGGLAPCFQFDGFVKPDDIVLVDHGRPQLTLVSPRSAREYGCDSNSGGAERPEALSMAPGALPPAHVLPTLGTGVYISNLHYLNYSDRQACRITGMTRFACLWVEDGVPVAPIEVMRFDDSLLRMFGEGLVALTDRAELVPDGATYGARKLGGYAAPGAIVDGFLFTL